MPFDSLAYVPLPLPTATVIDDAGEPCPEWTALNPDRALAFLFVAPQDCAAVDVLARL